MSGREAILRSDTRLQTYRQLREIRTRRDRSRSSAAYQIRALTPLGGGLIRRSGDDELSLSGSVSDGVAPTRTRSVRPHCPQRNLRRARRQSVGQLIARNRRRTMPVGRRTFRRHLRQVSTRSKRAWMRCSSALGSAVTQRRKHAGQRQRQFRLVTQPQFARPLVDRRVAEQGARPHRTLCQVGGRRSRILTV